MAKVVDSKPVGTSIAIHFMTSWIEFKFDSLPFPSACQLEFGIRALNERDLNALDLSAEELAMKSAQEMQRVLIVDDSEINLRLVALALEHFGYSVSIVADSRQAIQRIRDFRPDLILLDIQMPNLDGYEVARQVRCEPGFERVPILALTCLERGDCEDKAAAVGMNGYLRSSDKTLVL